MLFSPGSLQCIASFPVLSTSAFTCSGGKDWEGANYDERINSVATCKRLQYMQLCVGREWERKYMIVQYCSTLSIAYSER